MPAQDVRCLSKLRRRLGSCQSEERMAPMDLGCDSYDSDIELVLFGITSLITKNNNSKRKRLGQRIT